MLGLLYMMVEASRSDPSFADELGEYRIISLCMGS